jgi:hypothetical protein
MPASCQGSFAIYLANVFSVTPKPLPRNVGAARAMTSASPVLKTSIRTIRPRTPVHSQSRALSDQITLKLPPRIPRRLQPRVDASFVHEKVENKAPNAENAIRTFRVSRSRDCLACRLQINHDDLDSNSTLATICTLIRP